MNTSATFFYVSMCSKRINPLFISTHINWNFISMFWSLMNNWFFSKTILDWLSQWIVVGFLSNSSSIIVLNSALSYKASWFANDIAINSTLHIDKATEFYFLNFHEIMGLFSANLKQNPLTLFLSSKLPQFESQNPSIFKGFCDFLNISDWLIVLLNNIRRVLHSLNGKNFVLLGLETTCITNVWSCCNHYIY